MALPLFTAVLVALAMGAVSAVCGQMDGCGSDLSTFLPSRFNSSALACRPLWNNFILRYSQDQDNILSIVVSAVYTSGWVGMGFSNDGLMIGSSAMVGWIGRGGRAHIKQYYLRGQSTSEVIVDEGQLLATEIAPAVILYGVNIYLAFQVKFSVPISQQELLFAFATATPSGYHLTKHDDRISISFDFSAGSDTPSDAPYPLKLKRNHGVLSIFGWGVLLPIGAFVARYCRGWDPLWFYLHIIIQFAGFLIRVAGVVAGIGLYDRFYSNVSVHRGLGIFVFVLDILQVIAFFLRPDKDSKIRRYWNWYHHWIGRLALLLASVNIFLGIQVGGAGPSWKVAYGINLALILVTSIALEILLWTRWHMKSSVPPAL